ARNAAVGEDGFDLRAETEIAVIALVKERLNASMIADQIKRPGATIPDRDAVHAIEMVHHLNAQLFVEMDEHLGVGARAENVAALGQRKTLFEFSEIVYFA